MATQRSAWKMRPQLLFALLLLVYCASQPVVQCQLELAVPLSMTGLFGGPNVRAGSGPSASITEPSAQRFASLAQQHDSSPQPMDLITARGFIGEAYAVPSRDGSPITLYRIVNPLANQRALNKYPVLVFHGLSGDASQLISNSELSKPRRPLPGIQLSYDEGDRSLPFMLANNNFDVYMVDARGTNLNNHRASADLDPLEANQFWNYTLDEQSQLDLPTAIDFVLEQTQTDKLHYVGYSESTTFMLALLANQPHYQRKLASAVLIAPVAYLTHLRGSILALLVGASLTPDQVNGNYLPQPVSDTVGAALRKLCSNPLAGSTVCKLAADGLTGVGISGDDPTSLFTTAFKATAIKSLKHFYQLHVQKRFGMYDYGPVGNLRQYGQLTPPAYNLANIRLPTLIIARGTNDFLSTPEDQLILLRQLGTRPLVDLHLDGYNHLDFFIARDSLFRVNIPIVKTMLDILQSHGLGGDLLRDTQATPKRLQPLEVRMPSASRSVEVYSNLVPNLVDGIAQARSRSPIVGGQQQLARNGIPLALAPLRQDNAIRHLIPGLGQEMRRFGVSLDAFRGLTQLIQ